MSTNNVVNYQILRLSVCYCMPLCFRVFYPLFVMEFLVMTNVDHVNQSCFVGRRLKIVILICIDVCMIVVLAYIL